MASGELSLSKWYEKMLLTYTIWTPGPTSAYGPLFNTIWKLPLTDGAAGFRVLRAKLCTACDPNDISGNNYTELTAGNGYPDSSNLDNMPRVIFETVDNGLWKLVNRDAVSFGPATADWTPVTHMIIVAQCYKEDLLGTPIWTGSNDDKILLWYEFSPPIQVLSGETLIFPANGISVSMT